MDEAMQRLADRCTFSVLWKPYFLDEGLTDEGLVLEDFMRKLKGEEAAQKTLRRQGLLYQEADKLGIHIDVGRWVNQSVRSHCLLDLAANADLRKQHDLVELMFHGHLSEGKWINDVDFLMDCVMKVGLDRSIAMEYMDNASNQQRMFGEYHAAVEQIGLTRLPFLLFAPDHAPDKQLAVAGDQSVETFVQFFDTLLTLAANSEEQAETS